MTAAQASELLRRALRDAQFGHKVSPDDLAPALTLLREIEQGSVSSTREQIVGRAVLAKFNAYNERRAAQGARLRAAVGEILSMKPDVSAEQILATLQKLGARALERETLPSLRTIHWHMSAIRKA
ncbi:MAG: hypothetical protein ABI640_10790 [Gammaproteobacteria bacterium]